MVDLWKYSKALVSSLICDSLIRESSESVWQHFRDNAKKGENIISFYEKKEFVVNVYPDNKGNGVNLDFV